MPNFILFWGAFLFLGRFLATLAFLGRFLVFGALFWYLGHFFAFLGHSLVLGRFLVFGALFGPFCDFPLQVRSMKQKKVSDIFRVPFALVLKIVFGPLFGNFGFFGQLFGIGGTFWLFWDTFWFLGRFLVFGVLFGPFL